jgi:hypothetical protein
VRFRYLLALVVALVFSNHALAQVGVYGTVTGAHLSGFKPPYPYTDPYGFWTAGGTFGIYDDFLRAGPVHVGIDARGSILNTHDHKFNSGLGGVRVAFKPPRLPLRPYIQGSIGAGSTGATISLVYQVLGGMDITFFPHVDWRAVEVGGGAFHANGNNYPLVTISTGVVIRFR